MRLSQKNFTSAKIHMNFRYLKRERKTNLEISKVAWYESTLGIMKYVARINKIATFSGVTEENVV